MNSEWQSGYTAALMQLEARIQADHKKPPAAVKAVLNHIQDLLGRCTSCGGWVYGDGSCITCEQAKQQPK
jgi:hypothetical protein